MRTVSGAMLSLLLREVILVDLSLGTKPRRCLRPPHVDLTVPLVMEIAKADGVLD